MPPIAQVLHSSWARTRQCYNVMVGWLGDAFRRNLGKPEVFLFYVFGCCIGFLEACL